MLAVLCVGSLMMAPAAAVGSILLRSPLLPHPHPTGTRRQAGRFTKDLCIGIDEQIWCTKTLGLSNLRLPLLPALDQATSPPRHMMLRLLRSMRAVKPLCALSLHKSLHKTGLTSSLLCHSSSGLRSVSSSSKSPPSPKVKSPARPVYKAPAVRVPTLDRLQGINEDWGLELEENEVEGLRGCMRHAVEAYQRVDELTNSSTTSSFAPLAQFPRIPGGHRPSPEENYCNAWYMQTDIRGRTSTKEQQQQQLLLEGKTVAIKDTIAVAGVPMMNGSRILEGYTPIFEATVVTRVLEAGGIIKGKAVAEDLVSRRR